MTMPIDAKSVEPLVDFTNWVIAYAACGCLLGKMDKPGILEPVWELRCDVGRTPDGKTVVMHHAAPILFLESIKHLQLGSEPVTPVESLDKEDRAAIAAALERGQKLAQALRLSKSGLVLSPDMPPRASGNGVPPMPTRFKG